MKTDQTLRHDNRDKDERIRELEATVEALREELRMMKLPVEVEA